MLINMDIPWLDQLMAANVDLICHLSFIAVVVCQDSQQLADNYEGYTRVKYIHGTMFWSMCVHFPRSLATMLMLDWGITILTIFIMITILLLNNLRAQQIPMICDPITVQPNRAD